MKPDRILIENPKEQDLIFNFQLKGHSVLVSYQNVHNISSFTPYPAQTLDLDDIMGTTQGINDKVIG